MRLAVSACLLGEPCRYDGLAKPHEKVIAFAKRHEVLPVCPEMAGGLSCPRVPSEIVRGTDEGASVSSKRAGEMVRVVAADGTDVTDAFVRGAQETLTQMQAFGCELAILKAKSPSCGSGFVYDGTFSGTLRPGWGIAAALIRDEGIPVTDENAPFDESNFR